MAYTNDQEKYDQTTEEATEQPIVAAEQNYKELFLRLNADMQNLKRRTEREKMSWMQDAQADVLAKIAPLFDELQRAVEQASVHQNTDQSAWIQGFALLAKNFSKTLQQLGVQEIPCQGQFDPEKHEALLHVESPTHASGDVVQCFAKGYQLKEKVLCHAKVSVAK